MKAPRSGKKRPNAADLLDHFGTLSIGQAVRFGFYMAVAFSLYAVALVVMAAVISVIVQPSLILHNLRDAAGFLPEVVAAYFAAFLLAGALLGIVNHARTGPLRYPLIGFVGGASLYGVVGAVMKVSGMEDMSWRFVLGLAGGLGVVWAVLASLVEARRWSRRRHSDRSPT